LQRCLIADVIADAGSHGCELFYDLGWDVIWERRLGRVKRGQGLLQRASSPLQGPVPLQAPFFEQELGAQQRLWRGGRTAVEQGQRLLGQAIRTPGLAARGRLTHRRKVMCPGGLRMTSGLPMGGSACVITWQGRERDWLDQRSASRV
jgi:hypothetical protein